MLMHARQNIVRAWVAAHRFAVLLAWWVISGGIVLVLAAAH